MTTPVAAIAGDTELERLVARSRLIGSDRASSSTAAATPRRSSSSSTTSAASVRVLRIKGSGSDLATIEARHFPGLRLDELLPLRERDAMTDEEMVAYLARCLVEPDAPRPSIETLLHAFLPAAHVDHVHADAICALANAPDPEAAVHEALGDDVAVVPYLRPGFELSKRVAELADARAVVLAHHGLVTWGETHEESYGLTLELVAARTRVPRATSAQPRRARGRGRDSRRRRALSRAAARTAVARARQVLAVDGAQRGSPTATTSSVAGAARARPTTCSGSARAPACSTSTATSTRPSAGSRTSAGRVYERNAGPADAAPMLDPSPRVALVRGLGCVAAGARRAHGARQRRARRALARGASRRRSTRSARRAGSTSAMSSSSSTGRSSSTS